MIRTIQSSIPSIRSGTIKRQALVFSTFVKAFGKSLISGMPREELPPGHMQLWGQNVHLYLEPDICLALHGLYGHLVVKDPARPLALEAKGEYDLHVRGGSLSLDEESLENLINRYAIQGSMIERIQLSIEDGLIRMTAKVRFHGIAFPVSLDCEVSLTREGLIQLAPTHLSSPNVLVGGFMRFFPVSLEKTLVMPKGSALSLSGNLLRVDPGKIVPAPRVFGRLKKIHLEGKHLHLCYEGTPPDAPLLHPTERYLLCLGHELELGKLLLRDTRLQVIGLKEEDALDFSLTGYREQLAQGCAQLGVDGEILASIPNLHKIPQPPEN